MIARVDVSPRAAQLVLGHEATLGGLLQAAVQHDDPAARQGAVLCRNGLLLAGDPRRPALASHSWQQMHAFSTMVVTPGFTHGPMLPPYDDDVAAISWA